jgi:hypothetical protein
MLSVTAPLSKVNVWGLGSVCYSYDQVNCVLMLAFNKNVNLTKCQVDQMASLPDVKLTKCQVNKLSSWPNDK